MKKLIVIIALLFSFLPARSWAHHGGISLAFGPGTPIDTSSPFTLPQGGFVLSGRLEQVEWRLNLAGVYGFYRRPEKFLSQVDGVLELNLLRIGRDEEGGEKLRATGGTILYLSPGARMIFPKLWNASLGLLVKFPVVKDLNEKNEQQGAEGLEKCRFIATLSFFF